MLALAVTLWGPDLPCSYHHLRHALVESVICTPQSFSGKVARMVADQPHVSGLLGLLVGPPWDRGIEGSPRVATVTYLSLIQRHPPVWIISGKIPLWRRCVPGTADMTSSTSLTTTCRRYGTRRDKVRQSEFRVPQIATASASNSTRRPSGTDHSRETPSPESKSTSAKPNLRSRLCRASGTPTRPPLCSLAPVLLLVQSNSTSTPHRSPKCFPCKTDT